MNNVAIQRQGSQTNESYEWLTPHEASEYLGLNYHTIRQLMNSGALRTLRTGSGCQRHHIRTTRAWCDEYVSNASTERQALAADHGIPQRPNRQLFIANSAITQTANSILEDFERKHGRIKPKKKKRKSQ